MTDDQTPPPDEFSTEEDPVLPPSPERVGHYRILQKIGEGGMGEVYLAEQEKPIRRRVALKIIKRGMDTDRVIARFEAERQALAMMNHPNVAKVFDAGATERGRPYFSMEYVKGESITKYCDKQRLTTPARLGLFTQVCEGIQHAHQKAIIHRDIKPTNVLVAIEGQKPVPKIIDFGVAKAIEHRLTEKTIYTELGQLIGTPEYMSPEQAEMTTQDIDTRTDVYSLGVLLYELLVGALPFDPRELRSAGFDEIRRKIREEEPSKPSTRLSTLGEVATGSARNRRTDPASLARQLRGDLDWITMKALEKDRTRRYGSPSELAADIGRQLNDEPVLASPPRTAYRARKFVRRHWLGTAILVSSLLLLGGFGLREWVLSRRIEQEAATSQFFRAMVLEQQGSYADAERLLFDVSETRRRALGPEDERTLTSILSLARVRKKQGRYADAEALYLEILESRRRVLGDDHWRTSHAMYNLGCLAAVRGDRALALDWFSQAVERGFPYLGRILDSESDLQSLRGDPAFEALIERSRRNAAQPEE